MKKVEKKKKKLINDLLDKKFNKIDKIVGGIGCHVIKKLCIPICSCVPRECVSSN